MDRNSVEVMLGEVSVAEMRRQVRSLIDAVNVYAQESAALNRNLTAVQARCTELLEENREMKAELARWRRECTDEMVP